MMTTAPGPVLGKVVTLLAVVMTGCWLGGMSVVGLVGVGVIDVVVAVGTGIGAGAGACLAVAITGLPHGPMMA